jgi:hypothetical protein
MTPTVSLELMGSFTQVCAFDHRGVRWSSWCCVWIRSVWIGNTVAPTRSILRHLCQLMVQRVSTKDDSTYGGDRSFVSLKWAVWRHDWMSIFESRRLWSYSWVDENLVKNCFRAC